MLPERPFPLDRVRLINSGETLNVGDRNLLALRPPLFDSPATVGFLDDQSGLLFSSDCFGAPLPTAAAASAHPADHLHPRPLAAAQTARGDATIDIAATGLLPRDDQPLFRLRLRNIAVVCERDVAQRRR